MTPDPKTADPNAPPSRRATLAIAMDMEGLALMERTPVGWVRRSEAALNDEGFPARMAALRDEALALGGADGVEIWLPKEQVLSLHVAPEAPGPGPFRRALAAATPHALAELTWDAVPVEGGFAVAAAWRKTVQEAREFSAKWDLPVRRVTTRAADEDFPNGPTFDVTPPAAPPAALTGVGEATRSRKPALALAAGVLALGLGGWFWFTGTPDLPSPEAVWAPNGALVARTTDGSAKIEQASPSTTAPLPPPEPVGKAPPLERSPDAPLAAELPKAAPASGLGGGDATDQTPRAKAEDAAPGRETAPELRAAPPPDRVATLAVEPDVGLKPEVPPTVVVVRPLSPVEPVDEGALAAIEPGRAPEAVEKVSVLAEEPKGLADVTPSAEVMGTEFAPLPPPPDPEDAADKVDAEAPAEKAPEIPTEYIAGPDAPRPPPKPGDEPAQTASAGAGAAGSPPLQPTETLLSPESPKAADEPSAHALAAAPRPLPKPVSAKDLAEAEGLAPTAFAAVSAPRPVRKPAGLKRRAGALAIARAKARDEARLAAKAAGGNTVSAGGRKQIPASASLAAAATTRNAVDLSRTILVGVFGSTSSRRAILRLPNGDIRRVKRGETVDGWKIASIGQSSIKMTKSGKSQTLNVPGE